MSIGSTYCSDNNNVEYPSIWFTENFEVEKGRNLKVGIKDVLEVKQSRFQKIEMFETVSLGKMLVLDGVIQLTEFDTFAYHEMITHVPMNAHPTPKKVLVVGGGDGGVIKEVCKYTSVEEIVMCEIDEDVVNISKKYFPQFASAFKDERVELIIDDAAKYIAAKENYFDVIIVDSSDPVGPASTLFNTQFYKNMKKALTKEGIAVTQSESMYFHLDFIEELYKQNKEIYEYVSYYYTLVPTYPSGTIGFSYCSKKYDPITNLNEDRIKDLGSLEYYNLDIHKAAFILPGFTKKQLKQ